MRFDRIELEGFPIEVYSLNTAVVGSGAAGLNAADRLYSLGVRDIAVVTEGLYMGTSRNTGSDKQTYYKLTLSGDTPDSVMEMAKTLFDGGSMNGDIALVEAALSAQCFYRLVDIGVPFPHNRYGEYVGYKTDHDPRQRATSAGPLTSKYMTDKLQEQVVQKGIRIFDGYQVIAVLTDPKKSRAVGLLALNLNELQRPEKRFVAFNCTNIVYATGGPAGLYRASVYPESQTGATGLAFEAGAKGRNLTEWQYGIASIKFRWNLSGTYQQVIPRYISTKADGSDEREFLQEFFDTPDQMLKAVFLKGYQWPFDPRKVHGFGSSLIDLLVYYETNLRGRRVFLDYTQNPRWGSNNGKLEFHRIGQEGYSYLEKSGALFGKPIDRLMHMNEPAVELYRNHGIDLTREPLEIAVCAQHNNGGLAGNIWWESNIKHFFPVGEVNGTFGIYRPGGSALNSTQVGSLRAAQYITTHYMDEPMAVSDFIDIVRKQVEDRIELAKRFATNRASDVKSNVMEIRKRMQERMSKYGAHIRSYREVLKAIEESRKELEELDKNIVISSISELPDAFRNRDIAITQYVYLNAIKEYMEKGGKSRGSYLIQDDNGKLPVENIPEVFRYSLDDGSLSKVVNEIGLEMGEGRLNITSEWKPVRPIPEGDSWFENVWRDYREKKVFSRE